MTDILDAMQRVIDDITRKLFDGRTLLEAHAQHICIACGQKPILTTLSGRMEYAMSALCEACFELSTNPPCRRCGKRIATDCKCGQDV
jgi:hypothetical protein